jgi:tRNA(His) 5'-end guanylyltransferase
MDALSIRMKAYEHTTRQIMPRRSYTITRVDGRAFRTLLRNAQSPVDYHVLDLMGEVARSLCMDISGAVLGYVQSDEVSVLSTDFDTVRTQPHFGGVVQKLASTAAATATAAWHQALNDMSPPEWCGATFDGRVFQIPDQVEVVNYFLWRQRDAKRNALQLVARHYASHAELQGMNTDRIHRLLAENHILFGDFPESVRRGRYVFRLNDGWCVATAPEIRATPLNPLALLVPAPSQFERPGLPTRRVYPIEHGPDCEGHDEVMGAWRNYHMEQLDKPASPPFGRYGIPVVRPDPKYL